MDLGSHYLSKTTGSKPRNGIMMQRKITVEKSTQMYAAASLHSSAQMLSKRPITAIRKNLGISWLSTVKSVHKMKVEPLEHDRHPGQRCNALK